MEPPKFSWRARATSFVYAFAGLRWFFKHEHNARIHGVATILVIIISFVCKISKLEFMLVLLAIALVLVAEMINSAIEKSLDHLSPGIHPTVKIIKDLAAAAVLVAAIIAIIIGLIIFIPKIL